MDWLPIYDKVQISRQKLDCEECKDYILNSKGATFNVNGYRFSFLAATIQKHFEEQHSDILEREGNGS